MFAYIIVLLWIIYVIGIIFATEIFAYFWHRYGAHDDYIPGLHESHRIHHLMDLNDESDADEDFIWILMLMNLFELAIGIGILIGFINPILAIVTVSVCILIFLWNWWIHRAYHQKDHWLNNYDWFQEEKRYHYAHHYNPRKNYGIASHFMDKIFDTWENIDPDIDKLLFHS